MKCIVCEERERQHGRKCNTCRNQKQYYKNTSPCECGCGGLAAKRFIWGHQARLLSPEEQTRRGRMNNGDALRGTGIGYVKTQGIHEHRRVAEEILDRPLESWEIVHHKDRDKKNNAPSNLLVMSRSEHINLHRDELNAGRA
jgi:hypothetical protein